MTYKLSTPKWQHSQMVGIHRSSAQVVVLEEIGNANLGTLGSQLLTIKLKVKVAVHIAAERKPGLDLMTWLRQILNWQNN
jgi:hypothetical protein